MPETTSSREPSDADRIDAALVERAVAGELAAFNELVVRHQDRAYRLAARIAGDDADDAVSEAFLRAWRKLGDLRGGSFGAWLGRIVVNAATDAARAKGRRRAEPLPDFEGADGEHEPPSTYLADDPERSALSRERADTLRDALAQLPDAQRTAILLADVEGYDYAEIAAMTGVALGTVKSRVFRGRVELRRLLETRMELFHR